MKEENSRLLLGILTNQQFLFFMKAATDKPNQISVLKLSNQNSFILKTPLILVLNSLINFEWLLLGHLSKLLAYIFRVL